jgi:hypothetical protein
MQRRLVIFCFLLFAARVLGAEPPLSEAGRELLLPAAHSIPAEAKWVNGRIVLIHRKGAQYPSGDDDSVAVLDAEGRELFWRAPGKDFPEADRLAAVRDATVTPGGVVVVTGELWSTGGQRAQVLIQYRLSDRSLIRLVRTSPIYCRRLAADDEGTWCVGYDVPKQMAGTDDYDILYRFSPDGRLAGSYHPRSIYPTTVNYFAGGQTGGFPWVALKGRRGYAWLPAVGEMLSWSADGSDLTRTMVKAPSDDADEPRVASDGRLLSLNAIDMSGERSSWRRRLESWDSRATRWIQEPTALADLPLGVSLIDLDGGSAVLWDRYSRSIVFHPLHRR